MDTTTLVNNFTRVIVNPLILLLFSAGLLVFFWGVIEFLWGLNQSGEATAKEAGKRHMLWGLAGMFIMAAAWSIIKLLDSSVGSNAIQY